MSTFVLSKLSLLKLPLSKCTYLGVAIFALAALSSCTSGGLSSEYNEDTGTYIPMPLDSTPQQKEAAKLDSVKPKAKAQLHFETADEAIQYMNASPNASRYASGILPNMATESLKYVTKLLNSEYPYFFIVDKEIMRVGVFDRYGQEVVSYGICCSRRYGTKHKRADNRTPEGFFSVEGIYDSTHWLYTNDNGYTSPARGQFGPRFIRLAIPNTMSIGIHGTSSPGSIGRRSSHGCIRVTNDNIFELIKYAQKGMPVIVTPSARDQQVNRQEGTTIAKISSDPYGLYDVSEHSKVTTETKPKADKPKAETARHQPKESEAEPVSTPTEPESATEPTGETAQ